MESRKIKMLLLIGLIAISGIVGVEIFWLKEAFDQEEKKFEQKVHVALLEVVKKLLSDSQDDIPQTNPIRKVSKDYYVININFDIHAEILDFYLKNEFEKMQINTDYEYAIYNCNTDEMVYGNYINYNPGSRIIKKTYFPKYDNFVYYFAVRFPNKVGYFFSSLQSWIILSAILLLVLGIYVYSIFVILKQRRYSELQKDFINNMTHEFKTPLSSILIASNYLNNQPLIQSEHRLSKYTNTIISQGNRLNEHVEKILNLARSEKLPVTLDRSVVNMSDMLHLVMDNFQIKTTQPNLFTFKCEHPKPLIWADEVHFSNLVYNLIDNAIKYCDQIPGINITIGEKGACYILEIADNARGIADQHFKNIFKKFYRIPVNNHQHVNGFGLGLFYVKNICKMHQWNISVDRNDNGGSTFQINIPKYKS